MRLLLFASCLLLFACGETFSGNGDGGSGGASGTSTSSGGSGNADPVGCADGNRELFTSIADEPRIAGCQGGFDVPGVVTPDSLTPQCDHEAGNNSSNTQGLGCSVADLCAPGWHVCDSAEDVAENLASSGCPPTADGDFWVTRQSTPDGSLECVPAGHDNLVGCSQHGQSAPTSCQPLNRVLIHTLCPDVPEWHCGGGTHLADAITKPSAFGGGVLCCLP